MARRDKKAFGHSKLIPYIEHEHAEKRHARRLRINTEYYDWFANYLSEHGYTVQQLTPEHWRIYKAKEYYEFWPGLAKLVKNRKYRQGIHCHDVYQVVAIIIGVSP